MKKNYHLYNAKLSLNTYEKCLINYSTYRKENNFVGQFYDKEGAESLQYGLFGTSIFCIDSFSIKNDILLNLQNQSIEYLNDIVQKSNFKRTYKNSHINEVKRIILKIGIVYKALLKYNIYKNSVESLLNRLKESQKNNGSWGFFTNSKKGHIVTTSIIIRTIENNEINSEIIIKGIYYILNNYKKNKNLFQSLYSLNSILIIIKENDLIRSKIKTNISRAIIKLIKKINSEIKLDPSIYPNPPIADYNDEKGRTRFYRLPPNSVILLESFTLVSNKNLFYLQNFTGKKIFDKTIKLFLQKNEFRKDLNGLRASTHSLHSTKESLELIIKQTDSKLSKTTKRFIGWFINIFTFGTNITLNFNIFLGSIIISLIIHYYFVEFKYTINIFLGLSLKSLLDIINSIRKVSKVE